MAEAKATTTESECDGPKQMSVFCSSGDVTDWFRGLRLNHDDGTSIASTVHDKKTIPPPQTEDAEGLNLAVSTKRFCVTCGIEFSDRTEQVSHFRSDWHRFNLKRKLERGLGAVTLEKFEDMADDLSSISGSDSTSESESDNADRSMEDSYGSEVTSHRLPIVYFRNAAGQLVSMYRCTLVDKKTNGDLVSLAPRVGEGRYWAVLMVGGGHFAGAIFDRCELLVHKTFHRYTVRAKRGTAQGLHDQKGAFAKSAGSSLRRYNEAQLVQNVQDLLQSWAEQLQACSLIFLRAPSYNKQIFFSYKNPPLSKADARIRMIPFPTRRPTMNEVKRVHSVLSSVTNHGCIDSPNNVSRSPSKKPELKTKVKVKNKVKAPVKGQSDPERQGQDSESESESEGEIEYLIEEQQFSTCHLKDFEVTKKPRRRKKKKEVKVKVTDEEIVEVGDNLSDDDKRLRDAVYSACKIGQMTALMKLVQQCCHDNEHSNTHSNHSGLEKKNECFDDLPVVDEKTLFGNSNSATSGDKDENVDHSNASLPSNVATVIPEKILALRFGVKQETMLHVTSRAEMAEMTYRLLEMGVDPAIKDVAGMVPYAVTRSKAVRNEYRRFMAAHPDRYDYQTAQIPAPLTDAMETERKMKENERKKQAKKAKKERQKAQRERDQVVEAENREKERFLQLSDREKRALAAERRLKSQVEASGGQSPVLSRCWQCAVDITGTVPFEYYDYRFCSPKCLKLHRSVHAPPR